MSGIGSSRLPVLLVLASTYPRWPADPEPGFVHELSRRLTERYRVIVLCPHAPGAKPRETMDGVEVVRYRYAPERWETLVNDGGIVTNLKRARWKLLLVPGFVLGQAWVAWRLMRRERVDVIHAHWLIPQGLIAALLPWLPGWRVSYVVTSHGADLYALKGRLLDGIKRFVARRAAAATVVSSAMRERLAALGVPAAHIHVLPMGVDLSERFTPDPSVPRSQHEILFVGRLVEKKGLRHLIAALPQVLEGVPDAFLTIVGFGPEEAALRQQVHTLGLQAKVHFLGAVAQTRLPALYRRAALFVAPFVQAESGDQEGLPVALMEAVACGCPVVAGDVAGIEDLLGRMKPYICVDARNAEMLASCICSRLIDSSTAGLHAQAVLEEASRRVDWNRIAAGYARLIAQADDMK
ncbi:glycosyltransferase [Ottowia sp.]|uniref:glycosyltransferase n=1 Tax=Ottowia sp. TaxID=1898956 RepID=UPI00262097D2|nr:glycosyltransferase [Ottowia sp.]